ncbi:Muskelin [Smittium mucronatum]|uniref:Muskelin n=1 Tax=Smittium mucronatum TaxID=133383 RepID=A0A1R0GYK2_9FUNG|nr:Muskelin [Smittium mucronatum]
MLENSSTRGINSPQITNSSPIPLNQLIKSSYGSPFLNNPNFRIVGTRLESLNSYSKSDKDRNLSGFFSDKYKFLNDFQSPEFQNSTEIETEVLIDQVVKQDRFYNIYAKSSHSDLANSNYKNNESHYKENIKKISFKKSRNTMNHSVTSKPFSIYPQENMNLDCILPYEIYSWSSFSANYFPHNIICSKPTEQESRWSTSANDNRQFITLRLERPALIPHVCNLREFKVFSGMSPDKMVEVLHSGLRNDDKDEIITIKQSFNGVYLPTQESQLFSVFNELQHSTGISFESPVLKNVFNSLIKNPDYSEVESLIMSAYSLDLFQPATLKIPYSTTWEPIPVSDNQYEFPIGRGGHQMCIDDDSGKIYLFGGWDGKRNLADLWSYEIVKNCWKCISSNTLIDGGPDGRSLHSMCLDTVSNHLYITGKFIDHEYRDSSSFDNELFRYDINLNRWEIISLDTANDGGPKLLYDSQMVFDPLYGKIYIYGGKILSRNSSESGAFFGGLYSFGISTGKWTQLRPDFKIHDHEFQIQSRVFHSMTIDSKSQRLFILSGQKDLKNLGDFLVYDIKSNTFFEKTKDYASKYTPKDFTKGHLFQQKPIPLCNVNPAGGNQFEVGYQFGNNNYNSYIKNISIRSSLQWYVKNGYHIPESFYDSPPNPQSAKGLLEGINCSKTKDTGNNGLNNSIRSIRATFDSKRKEIYVITGHFYNDTISNQPLLPLDMDMVSEEIVPSINSHHVFEEHDITYLNYNPKFDDEFVRVHPNSEFQNIDRISKRDSKSVHDEVLNTVLTYKLDQDEWQENYNSKCFTISRDDFDQNILSLNIKPEFGNQNTDTNIQSKSKYFYKYHVYPENLNSANILGSNGTHFKAPGKIHTFPTPRYAMSVVYSENLSTHFMFGGNPNTNESKTSNLESSVTSGDNRLDTELRLNDFWKMRLPRPNQAIVLREAIYLIRQAKFKELSIDFHSRKQNLGKDNSFQESLAISTDITRKYGATKIEDRVIDNLKKEMDQEIIRDEENISINNPNPLRLEEPFSDFSSSEIKYKSKAKNQYKNPNLETVISGPFSDPRSTQIDGEIDLVKEEDEFSFQKDGSYVNGKYFIQLMDFFHRFLIILLQIIFIALPVESDHMPTESKCLEYLHTMILPLVDFDCEYESKRYKELTVYLFTCKDFEDYDHSYITSAFKRPLNFPYPQNLCRKKSTEIDQDNTRDKKISIRLDLINDLENLLCSDKFHNDLRFHHF